MPDVVQSPTTEELKRTDYFNVERTEKGILAVGSTSIQDRQGDIVEATGWDLKNFKKNPVLQWAHDHTIPAIGQAKNIRVEGEGKKARLVFEPVFHEITEFARAIKRMYEEGILNSFSVGYRLLDVDGNRHLAQELLEVSAVNVPANPEARMVAYKTMKADGLSDETIEKFGFDAGMVGKMVNLENTVSDLKEQMQDVVKGLKHLNPQGRAKEVLTTRQAMLKAIVRTTDRMLEERDMPGQKRATSLKVIKRATERLISDHKQELKSNGQDKRPSSETR